MASEFWIIFQYFKNYQNERFETKDCQVTLILSKKSIKRMKSATLDNLLISQHLIEYNLVRTINYILHLNNKFNCEATPLAINFPHLIFTLGQTEGLSQKIEFNTQNKTNVGILLVRNYLIISSAKSRKVFARTCIIRKTIMA